MIQSRTAHGRRTVGPIRTLGLKSSGTTADFAGEGFSSRSVDRPCNGVRLQPRVKGWTAPSPPVGAEGRQPDQQMEEK